MTDISVLQTRMLERFTTRIQSAEVAFGELTLVVSRDKLIDIALILRDEPEFAFDFLSDICGVDYLHYGLSEWETESATTNGFERGVTRFQTGINKSEKTGSARFAAVYHLLSLKHNHRVRIRVPLEESNLVVPSVVEIWPSANWFEREAYDLFGILFHGHPDLRRILTDYGFVGFPFRKDFPLIGNVEVRYDAAEKRVVYEPVNIEPRVLEPKVIRQDNRYETGE
jgi:NADH-quinone oxidoreductase subunit C